MKIVALLGIATLAAAAIVQAQNPGDSPPPADRQAARVAVMKACNTEITNLCAGKEGREVMMCLRSDTDKLSAGCKDALSSMPRRGPPGNPPQ
jgi:hypothetical protein